MFWCVILLRGLGFGLVVCFAVLFLVGVVCLLLFLAGLFSLGVWVVGLFGYVGG